MIARTLIITLILQSASAALIGNWLTCTVGDTCNAGYTCCVAIADAATQKRTCRLIGGDCIVSTSAVSSPTPTLRNNWETCFLGDTCNTGYTCCIGTGDVATGKRTCRLLNGDCVASTTTTIKSSNLSTTTTTKSTTTITISSTTASTTTTSKSSTTTSTASPTTTTTTKSTTTTSKTTTATTTTPPCPVTPLSIQTFDTSSATNLLSGDSGTGGTGGYTIANGFATWSPTISSTTAYWYSQLHASSASASLQCRSLYAYGSTVALSLKLGKINAGAATITVGVDIGCSTKTYKTIGSAVLNGVETKTFVFELLSGVSVADLLTVKAVVLLAVSGNVPVGSVFTIDDLKIVCSGSKPSPLPSPSTTTVTVPPSNVPLCNANGGSIDPAVPGVRPVVASRCLKAGQFALTFDDGPRLYEQSLVNKLNSYGIKATFFFNTANYVNIESEPYASWVRLAYNSGHQIASHTATHPDLLQLSQSQVMSQMQSAENAINNIIGRRPAIMRPPYGNYNDQTLQALVWAGYNAAVIWNTDTLDWSNMNAQQSLEKVKTAIEYNCPTRGSASVLELSHSTVDSVLAFVDLVVPYVQSRGYTFVTVSECIGVAPYK